MNLQSVQISEKPANKFGDILNNSVERKKASTAAFKIFLKLMKRWQVTGHTQCALLGDIPRETFQRWKRIIQSDKSLSLSRDQMERISLCLGIEKGLKTIFTEDEHGLAWLKAENTDSPFNGQSPIERMTASGIIGLYRTRQYLDAWRGVR